MRRARVSAEYVALPRQAEPAHFEIYSVRDQVHWRLLSRNNRDGGQSSAGFADAASCRLGLARLREIVDQLQPQHVLTSDNRWNWSLLLGDEILARSSHSFDRRIRCVSACEWFYRTAPLATIREGLRIVRGGASSRSVGRSTRGLDDNLGFVSSPSA
jgi:hypothetical protein